MTIMASTTANASTKRAKEGAHTGEAECSSVKISFLVTGFGPFHDVSNNPTTVLAEELVDYLKRREEEESTTTTTGGGESTTVPTPLSSRTRTLVLETSAEAVREEMDGFYAELTKDGPKHHLRGAVRGGGGGGADEVGRRNITVLLHLGVNYLGREFQLEKYAYNLADFRMPDERGFWPVMVPIIADPHKSSPDRIETLLDVPALVQEVNNTPNPNPAAVVSVDPGRFVCNYTYFYSLDRFKCCRQIIESSGNISCVRCLFVHVPPFAVVEKEKQLQFVATLMEALDRHVRRIDIQPSK
jgi:pyroglutamyl-peptidase